MGARHSLHLDLRRMNEHMRNVHERTGMNGEEFRMLQTVAAAKTGAKGAYEAIKLVRTQDNFRTESVFEAKVGLLKSCFFFQSEEEALVEDGGVWWAGKGKANPFCVEVLAIFKLAREICDRAGSTLVRQHAVRDAENQIHPKVFLPVQDRAATYYAKSVAHFVYFCSTMMWAGRPDHDMSAREILRSVLFQRHTGITQTFITR